MLGDWMMSAIGGLLVVSLGVALVGAFSGFRSGDKTGRMLGLSPLLMIGTAILIVPFVGGYFVSNVVGEARAEGHFLVEWGPSTLSTLLILGAGIRGAFLFRRYSRSARRARRSQGSALQ